MIVLVTGGTGLLGTALKELCQSSDIDHGRVKDNNYFFISRKECDLLDYKQVSSTFQIYKPDIVIHLASVVGGVYSNMAHNYRFLFDNLKIHMNVLEACQRYKVKKLINILSTCVFPDNANYPLTSDQLHNGPPHFSNEGYAYSKRMLEVMSSLLCQTTDIRIINLIPTNLYGENDNYNIEQSHVIPALVYKMYLAKQNKTSFNVKGSGMARRQFVYAGDLAKIILAFVNMDIETKIVSCIVSPPAKHEVTIKDVVDILKRVFAFDGKIEYEKDYEEGQYKKTCDSKELQKFISNFTFTPLEAGLEKIVQHIQDNYQSIRK